MRAFARIIAFYETSQSWKLATGSRSMGQSEELQSPVFSVTRAQREKLMGHRAKVISLTGLSGAGKSTLANSIEVRLHSLGRATYVLDGDNLRAGLNQDLGFDQESRSENIRRAAEVSRLMIDAGVTVVAAFISPLVLQRHTAREIIGDRDFIEVYVSTPLAVCQERDPKGLYRRASAGKLPAMTGMGSEYQPPEDPHLIVDTTSDTTALSVTRILSLLD